jgi:hypothetical protein
VGGKVALLPIPLGTADFLVHHLHKSSQISSNFLEKTCLAVVEAVVVDLPASAAMVAEVAKGTLTWRTPPPRLLSSVLLRR